MKKALLLVTVSMLSCLGVIAQDWMLPEEPTKGSDVVAGHKYRIKNVAASAESDYNPNSDGYFLTGGTGWYEWATSTVLRNENEETPLTFTVTETEKGWVFQRTTDNLYTFISGPSPQGLTNTSEMHVDQGDQDPNLHFFGIKKVGDYYRIYAAQVNPAFSVPVFNEEGEPKLFWGWMPNNYDGEVNIYPWSVYGSVSPEKGWACDWEFIDYTKYDALMALYNQLMETSSSLYATAAVVVSALEKADDIYNSGDAATVEDIYAAVGDLKQALAVAKANAFLEGATMDDPRDATVLFDNPAFENGTINGWICTFKSGVNGTNVGYQEGVFGPYVGEPWHDVETGEEGVATCFKFIEAWANNNSYDGSSYFNPNYQFAALGDGKLCQVLNGLPAGLYKLSCDANAVQQQKPEMNPVTGVQLYAVGEGEDRYVEIATKDGVPEHRILTFILSKPCDVELGLRTNNTTGNWMCADNFTLRYYGAVEGDPEKIILDEYIASLEKAYGNLEDVHANIDAKAAYTKALAEASDATSDYQAVKSSLEAAVITLEASIMAYGKMLAAIGEAETKAADVESVWPGLSEDIMDAVNGWNNAWMEGSYTNEQAEGVASELAGLIANYISNNCKAGDDITILLKNPNFDKDFSDWQVTGSVPAWGGVTTQGPNNKGAMAELDEEARSTWGGSAEIYHTTFDMYQVITNLPKGLYRFVCQGFDRCDEGAPRSTSGMLYADITTVKDSVVTEQYTRFADIDEYLTDEPLYNSNDEWYSDVQRGGKWAPYGLAGAMYHFHHQNVEGVWDYTNELDIVLTEPSDIRVGARISDARHWVVFDSFKVIYMGSGLNVYEKPIEDMIAKGEAAIKASQVYGEGVSLAGVSQAVADDWFDVKEAAQEAYGPKGSEEACVEMLTTTLPNAIAAIEASAQKASALYGKYLFAAGVRLGVLYDADVDCSALEEFLAQVEFKLTYMGFDDDAEMENISNEIDYQFGKAVFDAAGLADATVDEPVDVTAAICNPRFTLTGCNTEGWTLDIPIAAMYEGYSDEGAASNLIETWQGEIDFHQDIYALVPGFYNLKLQGFSRAGGYNAASLAAQDSIDGRNAFVYAGEASTPLLNIFAEVGNYIGDGATVKGGKYDGAVVPNGMAEAESAFEQGLYWNTLCFEVTEEAAVKAMAPQKTTAAPLTIGIKKSVVLTDDWTIWANWKLQYLGTVAPEEDPTTAVERVNNAAIMAAQYFNINGMQQTGLMRGVNIVKVVKADGTAKMLKVIVK